MMSTPLPRPSASHAALARAVNASPDLAALEAAFEHPAEAGGSGREPPAHRLTAADGRWLSARWFEPAGQPARAVAVVNAATGVPQRFYRHFALWLAARGYAVLTYDYRGIGESRQGPLRAETARMRDWALLDMPAALAEAARRRRAAGWPERSNSGSLEHGSGGVPDGRPSGMPEGHLGGVRHARPGGLTAGHRDDLPLLLVGHSFGGNAIGLADGFEAADALLGVAAQSGDWRHWPGRHRWVAHAFFHAMLPAAAHLLGKAPGWVLGGSGAGLPKGVALDWARWGRRRGYLFSDPELAAHLTRYQQYRGPAHLWHISDDRTYGPAAAVDALAAQFSAARVERPALDAAALRSGPIGHFGAFRAEPGRRIWPQWLERIESASPALRAALHAA
jgi:predicted alpha/beta hydrolase